jgi:hypothetical protein
MAVKKAIVITNGQLEQLQAGDRLDLGNVVTKTNDSGGAVVIGQPVFVNGVNADLAQADSQSTIRVAGLVLDITAADASPVNILADGILVATTGQWDAVTGETGGLTPGANYFLDPATAGMLTQTAPTTASQFVVRVGHAVSTTEMEIEVQQPIKL